VAEKVQPAQTEHAVRRAAEAGLDDAKPHGDDEDEKTRHRLLERVEQAAGEHEHRAARALRVEARHVKVAKTHFHHAKADYNCHLTHALALYQTALSTTDAILQNHELAPVPRAENGPQERHDQVHDGQPAVKRLRGQQTC